MTLLAAGLDRGRDRVAAGGLGAVHPGRHRGLEQAEELELLERLVDLADQAAAGHRRDDVVGRPPAQVLGDLEAHRLGALGVERPQVDVDESPAEPEGDLRAEPVDLVVVPVDGDDLGAVDRRAEDLALLEPVGDEDVGVQPGGGGVGGDAVGQVARRGAADRLEAQLDGLRERHGHDAVLERQRRMIDGVVLDVELGDAQRPGQPIGADQRRAADLPADGRLAVDRQQLAIPPHRSRPRRDRLAVECPRDRLVVVGDFQRAEVLGAEIQGFLGIGLAAKATLQSDRCFHGHRCHSRLHDEGMRPIRRPRSRPPVRCCRTGAMVGATSRTARREPTNRAESRGSSACPRL